MGQLAAQSLLLEHGAGGGNWWPGGQDRGASPSKCFFNPRPILPNRSWPPAAPRGARSTHEILQRRPLSRSPLVTLAGTASSAAADPASRQTTYVIVHGAWGGGWAFRKVDALLTARGHKVYRPTLTGQGERVHLATLEVDLSTHVMDVVNMILFEELRDVVLIGHSYGGMVISGVAQKVPDRIRRLVYLAAFVPGTARA